MSSRNEYFLKPEVLLGQIRCHFCENDEKLSDKREGKFFWWNLSTVSSYSKACENFLSQNNAFHLVSPEKMWFGKKHWKNDP